MEILLTLFGWTCVAIVGLLCIAAGLAGLRTALTQPSKRATICGQCDCGQTATTFWDDGTCQCDDCIQTEVTVAVIVDHPPNKRILRGDDK